MPIGGSTESTQELNRVLLEQIRDLLSGISTSQDPLDKYVVHDEDSTVAAVADVKYIGYVSKTSSGKYLIVQQTTTSFPYTYRYANVDNNASRTTYTDAWTNRATLTYGYIYSLTSV